MYKLYKDVTTQDLLNITIRLSDGASIPFDPANTDYANFKKEVLEGAELQDADGNVMSPEAAQAFVATLP